MESGMRNVLQVILFLSFTGFLLPQSQQSLIVFNGIAVPSNLESWTWGNSVFEIESGSGISSDSSAIKWTQGEGGTGIGFTVTPLHDLSQVWQTDSVKFMMKSETDVDSMTLMFYDGMRVIVANSFPVIADNEWHQYTLPLAGFMPLEGSSSTFDPATIQFIELNTGLYAGNGTAGKIVYITNWWIGTPEFDTAVPAAPSGVTVTPGTFINTITWTDVPGETGEKYKIYYSKEPITDLTTADVIEYRVNEDSQKVDHYLRVPVSDQEVSYYYAVICIDASGNKSEPAGSGAPVTNLAKGVATISLTAPSGFSADGDLNEWQGITPIHMSPSDGGYTVSWGDAFTGDADLSVDMYLAMDNTYFYAAFNVEDDIVAHSDPSTSQTDSPDLHIGLYNYRGESHTSYKRGAEPDYLFRFASTRALIDMIAAGDSLLLPGENYFWGEKFPSGYVIEARIPWTLIAERTGDSLFTPVEGYRIPLDVLMNDADSTGARESMLAYSQRNDGNSWSDVSLWSYTWIGNVSDPVSVTDGNSLPGKYSLAQNYPNPFNPSTTISYRVQNTGKVELKIYDLLGRLVSTVVNEEKPAGDYSIKFNASSLASGVYYYRLKVNDFVSTRKMMLLK
jgi:hypothetical protein